MTDEKIVLLALKGEEDACRELFERHFSRVFRIALTYTGYHAEDAKDVTQNAFIQAFKRLGKLKEPDKFGPWIKTIARNMAIRHAADKRKRSETTLQENAVMDEHLWSYKEEDEQAKDMENAAIREIVESIPNGSVKETVQMYYLEGELNTSQIADRQGISKNTVTSRLMRFRAKYRKKIMHRILVIRGEE